MDNLVGNNTGQLFVHQYGIKHFSLRDKIFNICLDRTRLLVDDFCLCKPTDFFSNLINAKINNNAALISFLILIIYT